MAAKINTINIEGFGKIRVITGNNKVYFVGKDVAKCLYYCDHNSAIRNHVWENYKALCKMPNIYHNNYITTSLVITFEGLFLLVASSKLDQEQKYYFVEEIKKIIK